MRPTYFRSAAQAVKGAEQHILKKAAKKDPELWVLLGVMTGVFGLAGYYFGRKPTSSVSETKIAVSHMPWETDEEARTNSKYKYHPEANPKNTPKEAPGALNVVVIPDVTLPKVREIYAIPGLRAAWKNA